MNARWASRYAKFARSIGVAATFHDLLHFHASELVAQGVDYGTVGESARARVAELHPQPVRSRWGEADRRAALVADGFVLRGGDPERSNILAGEIRDHPVTNAG